MTEAKIVQDHLDQAVARLLSQGCSPTQVGLELLMLGTSLTTTLIGTENVASHLRRLAEALERTLHRRENDNGYSALG